MRKYTYFLTGIFILTLLASPALASSTTKTASDYLVEIGERSLESGDLQTAIHEFSKALMLNPDNQKAKALLNQYNINDSIYRGTIVRETQIGDLARDVRDYKADIYALENENIDLRDRVNLLEDAIVRKGDHQLLKELEDYYKGVALFDVDETLEPDEQLAALHQKHKAYKQYVFDKDRVQEKMIDVTEELLGYREDHLEDARNDLVIYRIALAQNRKDLLYKTDYLKKLSEEYDDYRQNHHHYSTSEELKRMKKEMVEANEQIDMLIYERSAVLNQIKEELKEIKRSL